MKISVILTVLNEGEGLATLLDALLTQSLPADEFVIVDGGSRDDTLAILQERARRDARLRVHVEPGVNIAQGRNIAIAHACGDVIAVTDGGCRPERDWLRELLAPMTHDAAVGAVAGRFVPAPASRFEHYCGRMSMPDMDNDSQRGMFYGRSSAFRRALWTRVGGYPEWLYTGEDTLFAIAVGHVPGWRVAYAPASVVHWRPRPSLFKMAKMFYLYGRGNGRIQHGSLRGSLYWLRCHAAVVISLVAGLAWPWAWLLGAALSWPLWQGIAAPNLAAMAGEPRDRLLYVPVIALVRNAATNLGFLRGWLEHRRGAEFQQRLERYLGRGG